MLVRDSAVESIALDLIKTGHWELEDSNSHGFKKHQATHDLKEAYPTVACDTEIDLQRIDITHDSEYRYLTLWPEKLYHINVDECPTVEVPDVYPWHTTLIEEKWHPAVDRESGW
jgi:hypothetical protein